MNWWQSSMEHKNQRLQWWRDARFGLFIHWGAYSPFGGIWKDAPPVGYSEHLMRACKIPLQEYRETVVEPFSPHQFDADSWVRLAKDTGARYLVITAKHHDGLALFPSAAYPYDIRLTRYPGDPIGELKAACDREGIAFGVYYSHAFDWEHPSAPGNDWDYQNPGGDLHLYEESGRLWHSTRPDLIHRVATDYVDQKAIPQILELIHHYQPALLWFDTPHKLPPSENLRILRAIREADPAVVVNGRIIGDREDGFRGYGDYINTADRSAEPYPCPGDWEAIPTTNESYGYSLHDRSHKEPEFFITLLAKSVAEGGNILLNVGPMGNGTIDKSDQRIFHAIGQWMKPNGESIYRCGVAPCDRQNWGVITQNGDTLYLHILQTPQSGKLIAAGLGCHIKRAVFLADQRELPIKRLNYYDWELNIASVSCPVGHPVIRLETDGDFTRTHSILLSENRTILHSFHGQSTGLAYGQGKAGLDYVWGFTGLDKKISWAVRSHGGKSYQAVIRYLARQDNPEPHISLKDRCDCGGVYRLWAGGKAYELPVYQSGNQPCTEDTVLITLPTGLSVITIEPARIDARELFKLYTVTLTAKETLASGQIHETDETDLGC